MGGDGTPGASLTSLDAAIWFDTYAPWHPLLVAQNAPSGPVAICSANSADYAAGSMAIVGVGPGAMAPNLLVPWSLNDGFTTDESSVLIAPAPADGATVLAPATSRSTRSI